MEKYLKLQYDNAPAEALLAAKDMLETNNPNVGLD